jgi:hypothetical protein
MIFGSKPGADGVFGFCFLGATVVVLLRDERYSAPVALDVGAQVAQSP